MFALLQHVAQVLTAAPELTSLVPVAQIAATVRKPGTTPAVEYSVTGFQRPRTADGKADILLELYIHSTKSEAECWLIADAIHRLMTAKRLTPDTSPLDSVFRVSQVRQTDARREPRNEWAATIRVEYSIKVVELDPVPQNQ
jgi:hypothetical protein